MSYPNTKVLQLGIPDTYSAQPNDLLTRAGNDQLISGAHGNIDTFAGFVTASACYSLFTISTGSANDVQSSTNLNGVFGVEYARQDRTFVEAVAWPITSGSGGVTTIDLQVGLVNFQSIFASTASMLALSASGGNFGVVKSSAFVSGTNTRWPVGTLMRAVCLTAAGDSKQANAQTGVSVQVFWKPSGSALTYGV
jgi:hypothetical protein